MRPLLQAVRHTKMVEPLRGSLRVLENPNMAIRSLVVVCPVAVVLVARLVRHAPEVSCLETECPWGECLHPLSSLYYGHGTLAR